MDVNSELKDAQLEILDADKAHSANTKGMIWYDRALEKVKVMYNSAIEILATESYVDNLVSTSVGDSENGLLNDGLITSERSDPSTPASGKIHVYGKTNGLYTKNDSGTVERLYTEADINSLVSWQKPVELSGNVNISYAADNVYTTLHTAPSEGFYIIRAAKEVNGVLSGATYFAAGDSTYRTKVENPSTVWQGYGVYIRVSSGQPLQFMCTNIINTAGFHWKAFFVPLG